MEPVRIILDDAPEKLSIPTELQHKSIEVIFWPLNDAKKPVAVDDKKIMNESAFGILDASTSVSLEKMQEAIKIKGASL